MIDEKEFARLNEKRARGQRRCWNCACFHPIAVEPFKPAPFGVSLATVGRPYGECRVTNTPKEVDAEFWCHDWATLE